MTWTEELHDRRRATERAAALAEQVGARTVTLADVAPERVGWLWPGYLPLGKLVTLDGDPGVAKSTLCLDLAARVSTGRPMPDGTGGGRPADVLLLSAEDGLGDTVRPRLDAAKGDPKRVHALTEVAYTGDDGQILTRPPSLPGDLPEIESIVQRWRVRLVVVDVLMAFLGGAVDSHRDQDVRRVLHQLGDLADRRDCTMILIRHLNKTGGSSAMYRGGGSIGIIGAARAALLAAIDPEDETGARRILAPVKMNLAVTPTALAYRLVSDQSRGCAAIEWLGDSDHNAATLLGGGADDDRTVERDRASEWLINYLADAGGPVKASDAEDAAKKAQINKSALYRARKKLRIVSEKDGMQGGWVWRMPSDEAPEDFTKVPKIAGSQALESSKSSEIFGSGNGTAA